MRVNLGNERSDRPHWMGVGAVAVGGLACGLVVMLALGRSLGDESAAPRARAGKLPPAAAAPATTAIPADTSVSAIEEAAEQATSPVAPTEPPAAEGAPALAVVPETTDELQMEVPAAVAAPAPLPAPAAPSPTSARHQLVRGHIAYLRCEGVPLQDGPFPCPRDRRFEKHVWSALERLQECPLPALGSNHDFELRVEFRTRGRHSFEVNPADGSEALASATRACLSNDLELVRTQLRPLLMTVGFRFELH